MTEIGRGAEAIIFRTSVGVTKHRIPKAYRHPSIDAHLRKSRTRRESNIFRKLGELGFPAPRLIAADDKEMTISMEFVDAPKVRDVLESHPNIATDIGHHVGILHAHDIIHGDLTTSNMLLPKHVVFIDFGLSFISKKAEDKAVDLRVLKQALESKHHEIAHDAWKKVLEGYKSGNPGWKEIFLRLEKVEKRGRNK